MEQKDFMQMCLDIYRYCRLYREQTEDEIGDFLYFFAMETLIAQKMKEGESDLKRAVEQLEHEQDRWLELYREEAARGKAAMKFLRELIAFYEQYSRIF